MHVVVGQGPITMTETNCSYTGTCGDPSCWHVLLWMLDLAMGARSRGWYKESGQEHAGAQLEGLAAGEPYGARQ